MFIVDDPMLALITRFVVGVERIDVGDQEFLEEQVRLIRDYVDQYPADQHQERAVEWVEAHAEHYRVAWQRRVISDRFAQQRCPDCPLILEGASAHCEIHDQWSRLVREYLGKKITSREHVEDTLRLLSDHKSKLRVTRQKPRLG